RLILTLILCLTACAVPTIVPTASLIPSVTPMPSSSPETVKGKWLGGVTKPDDSIASLFINFDNAKLNIEPMTTTWSMTVTRNGEAVNFSVSGKSNDPFTQIEFTGTFSNGKLSGEFNWDGKKSSVTFTPIVSVDDSVLEKYEGVYRF